MRPRTQGREVAFKVLYQPLPSEQRLSVQVAVETLLTPLTIGIAGALMVLFSRVLHYDPVVFAWVMLAGFACGVGWARTAGAHSSNSRRDWA